MFKVILSLLTSTVMQPPRLKSVFHMRSGAVVVVCFNVYNSFVVTAILFRSSVGIFNID